MRTLLAIVFLATAARADLITSVRTAVAARDVASADKMAAAYRAARGNTPELAFAVSWIARDLLDQGQFAAADAHAGQTRQLVLGQLTGRKLDAEPALPLALGASIEAHAQALEKQGQRSEAVTFLRAELVHWQTTSIRARIQKNLNLLTMEGKPAPPIDVTHWTGTIKPRPLSALRGHPVLLFFWAHWCADCKAEAPIIEQLRAAYGPRGLAVVGPTMHYGFAAGGEEASVDKETAWIEETRQHYYAGIQGMPVPVSEQALRDYGVSTTPTLVLVDSVGVVRMYHPGAMSYDELAAHIVKLLRPSSRSHA